MNTHKRTVGHPDTPPPHPPGTATCSCETALGDWELQPRWLCSSTPDGYLAGWDLLHRPHGTSGWKHHGEVLPAAAAHSDWLGDVARCGNFALQDRLLDQPSVSLHTWLRRCAGFDA